MESSCRDEGEVLPLQRRSQLLLAGHQFAWLPEPLICCVVEDSFVFCSGRGGEDDDNDDEDEEDEEPLPPQSPLRNASA